MPATPMNDAADRYSPEMADAFQPTDTERPATKKSLAVFDRRADQNPMPRVTTTVTKENAKIQGSTPLRNARVGIASALDGLDLVRAQLLTDIVYRQRDLSLTSFENIKPDVQERITFSVGNRYTTLRDWLLSYREGMPLPLDHFFRKLFGEVLSQAGFGYHRNFDAVRVAGSLVESVKNFRRAMEPSIVNKDRPDFDMGREYIAMLEDGVIAASYVESWKSEDKDAVLVSPAHTFIMMNRPVTYQFWIDPGSSGWYQRLTQPLTHPYVLSRDWEPGRLWTDADEVQVNQQSMARLISGLLLRCRERI